MKYKYKAIKKSGEVYESFLDVKTESDVYAFLKSNEETLVYVEEASEVSFMDRANSLVDRIFGDVKEDDKISFAHNLGAMIEAGLPVSRALDVIERQTKQKKFKAMIAEINGSIKKGKSLSSSMEGYPSVFSGIFTSMVRAGEESGNLSDSLRLVAVQLGKTHKLKKKIKGAMLYPSIVLSAMFIVGVLMLIFIVPTLTETFTELKVDLPKSTQAIIFISDTLKNHFLSSALFLALIIGALMYWKRTEKGKRVFDMAYMKIPIIGGLVIKTNSARTTRTLSSLLTSGVEVVRAIEISSEVIQNAHFREVLTDAGAKIQKGQTMSEIFKEYEHLYPPLVNEMMAVGEETGKLPELLMRVALFYEEDIEEQTKNLSTIIEPFLMVIIGTVVGFFAISMITPMYSLSNGL